MTSRQDDIGASPPALATPEAPAQRADTNASKHESSSVGLTLSSGSTIHDLEKISVQALSAGQACLDHANSALRECKNDCEKLDRSHSRILLLHSELAKQLHTLKKLGDELQNQAKQRTPMVAHLRTKVGEVQETFPRIFQKLQQVTVHDGFVRSEAGNEVRTLFDFVDADSVNSLQRQAAHTMQEIEEIDVKLNKPTKSIEAKLRDVSRLTSSATFRADYRVHGTSEEVKGLTAEVNGMSAMLRWMSTHCEQIRNVVKKGSCQPNELTVFQTQCKQLPVRSESMKESLRIVLKICDDVRLRSTKYNEVFDNTMLLVKEVSDFEGPMKDLIREWDDLQQKFEERKLSCCNVVEELSNLVAWYELFYAAYEHLAPEIQRRKKVQEEHNRVISDIAQKLAALNANENQKRQEFFDQHGRYLPPSLCPGIQECAVEYQLVHSHVETPLPALDVDPPNKSVQ